MLGTWVAILLRALSDYFAICELTCHPSLHLFLFSAVLLGIASGFLLVRRKSSFSGQRWQRRFVGTLIPFVFYAWVTTPWCLLPLVSAETSEGGIKILSWNIQIGNDNAKTILAMVEQQSPDVLVLIELTPFVSEKIGELKRSYPFHCIKPHSFSKGIAVYSRSPNSAFKELSLGGNPMPAIELTIQREHQNRPNLSILALHTLSPHLDDGKRVFDRNEQLAGIANWASETVSNRGADAVAIGDFNTTPWSPAFWRMLKTGDLIDSTWYRGYYPTWPAGLNIWAIAIDHALVSKNVKVLQRSVLPDTQLSDHRPITITVN